MHPFYYIFLIEVIIAVVAYTNILEYAFSPVKEPTERILTSQRQMIYLAVAMGVLFLFHAFREPMTLVDIPYYVSAFNEAKTTSLDRVLDVGYDSLKTETGFALFIMFVSEIFRYPQVLLILTSIFIFVGLYISIRNYSPIYWLSVFVFIINIFPQSLFVLRGYLAITVYLFSFPFIINRQIVPFLLFCLLALSVHMSSIIFMPVYFLYGIRNKYYLLGSLVVSAVILLLSVDEILLFFVENFMQSYMTYALNYDDLDGANWKMPALLSAILLVRIYFMGEHFFDDGIDRLLSIILILSLITYAVGMEFGLIGRIAMYFGDLMFLILPNSLRYVKSTFVQFAVSLGYIAFNSIFYFNNTSNPFWSDYSLISF